MIILDALTKAIEIDLSGAVATTQLPFTIAAVEVLDSDQSVADIINTNGASNSTTAVVMITGPASGKTRQVKTITVQNADTTGAVVTLQLNDNGTLRTLFKGLLDSGDNLTYED